MFEPRPKIPVAVLGATGLVGQRLVLLLAHHPWFEAVELAASPSSAGKPYGQVVCWRQSSPLPGESARRTVLTCDSAAVTSPLVFSALDAAAAGPVEEAFAAEGRAVVSNARSHRMEEDVPLLIPEVNPEQLFLIDRQRLRRGGSGFIVTNPNCSSIALTLALAPLYRGVGVRRAVVTTLQALSGAGYPGVSAMDMADNVLPFIDGEEEKIESEPLKILGRREEGNWLSAGFPISAQAHRVNVSDGHLLSINLEPERPVQLDEVRELLSGFRGKPQELGLPSAPAAPLQLLEQPDRPQPRLDRQAGEGMTVSIGRLRRCPVLGLRMEGLSHNTLRGAAGGTILIAELLAALEWLP